jgi:hypothetical protein
MKVDMSFIKRELKSRNGDTLGMFNDIVLGLLEIGDFGVSITRNFKYKKYTARGIYLPSHYGFIDIHFGPNAGRTVENADGEIFAMINKGIADQVRPIVEKYYSEGGEQ